MSSRKGRLIGFLLAAVFLGIVGRNVSWSELVAAFRAADYRLVVPATTATFTGYLLRTVRWQRIVKPVAALSFGDAFSILMMGFASNNLLPARLGEFVRAYLLGRSIGTRKTYGLATIVLERVCDGVTLIALLGAVSLLMPLPGWGQEVQLFSSLLFVGAAAGIVLLLTQEKLTMRVLGVAMQPFPRQLSGAILRASKTFITGLHSLKSGRGLGIVVLLSLVVWLLESSSYLLMTRAFGIWMPPLAQALAATFLLVVVNLGIMLPSAPGYVGTFQFFAVMALGVFGVPKETALAVAIASHLMQYVMVTAIGLLFFARGNVAFWRFEKEAEAADEEEAVTPAAAS
ncbi:MAG: lysylphosphatidylglycerol synthase transmembrane domain-containing protein [Chloroflexota bacterium]